MTGTHDTVAAFGALARAREHLQGAASVGALLASAADVACREGGFDRAVVLTVDAGHLSAGETDALSSPPSDRLRRSLLGTSVELAPGTEEHELVRRPRSRPVARLPSGLSERLELQQFLLSPVVPQAAVIALLVADRETPIVTGADTALMDAVAAALASELALLVQRTRVDELIGEVRRFSGLLVALGQEIHQAPVMLPGERGFGSAFLYPDPSAAPASSVESVLTPAEARIAALLSDGRSNREIAETLVLSPETVKSHVARILRKLGAANRAEAVSRYLRLHRS